MFFFVNIIELLFFILCFSSCSEFPLGIPSNIPNRNVFGLSSAGVRSITKTKKKLIVSQKLVNVQRFTEV